MPRTGSRRSRIVTAAVCLAGWVAGSLTLTGCSREIDVGLVHRLGPEGLARHQVGREVREVLPALASQDLAFELREGCRLEVGYANEASEGALTFAVTWLGPGSAASATEYRAVVPAGQGWTDVRVPAPDRGARGFRLTVDGEERGLGVWSRPRVLCPGGPSARAFRNVILISLDTLRADRLGVYGNPHGLTPNLDRIARSGTRFEHAYAHYPNTLGSHASLFTGQYPSRHGVGSGAAMRLGSGVNSLAREFASRGYATAAYTENGFVSSHYGFDVGFDSFHNGPTDAKFRGEAAKTFARGVSWLENRPDAPFFLFLHTYEVHTPYSPEPAALAQVMKERGERYGGKISSEFGSSLEILYGLGRLRLSPSDKLQIERLYDAEVKGLDREIGKLFQELTRLGLADSTLLVLLSDHGDGFFEHEQLMGHGESLYQEVLRVPLIFRLPGVVPSDKRLASRIGLIDVGPTIADIAGIGPIFSESPARSRADWIRRDPGDSSEPVFSELQKSYLACEDRKEDKTRTCPYDGVSVRDDEYTFIDIGSRDQQLLYEAGSDPAEERNLAGRLTDVTARYRKLADEYREAAREHPGEADRATIDPTIRESLRALGYVD